MTPQSAHLGRCAAAAQRRREGSGLSASYEWTVAALEREGNRTAPSLRAALDRDPQRGAVT